MTRTRRRNGSMHAVGHGRRERERRGSPMPSMAEERGRRVVPGAACCGQRSRQPSSSGTTASERGRRARRRQYFTSSCLCEAARRIRGRSHGRGRGRSRRVEMGVKDWVEARSGCRDERAGGWELACDAENYVDIRVRASKRAWKNCGSRRNAGSRRWVMWCCDGQ